MLARLVPVLIALASLGAGCISSPSAVDPAATSTDDMVGTVTGPVTERIEGDIMLSTATPVRSLNYGGAFSYPFTPAANDSGYVIEVEWDAATPFSEEMSVWLRPSNVGMIPPQDPSEFVMAPSPLRQADGASPLKITVPIADLEPDVEYAVIVRASAAPVGVAANQPFTIHFTAFVDAAFDEAFTALGTANETA